jgi:hypothetical protein
LEVVVGGKSVAFWTESEVHISNKVVFKYDMFYHQDEKLRAIVTQLQVASDSKTVPVLSLPPQTIADVTTTRTITPSYPSIAIASAVSTDGAIIASFASDDTGYTSFCDLATVPSRKDITEPSSVYSGADSTRDNTVNDYFVNAADVSWVEVSAAMGASRSAEECRLRWMSTWSNRSRKEGIKSGPWTPKEVRFIRYDVMFSEKI